MITAASCSVEARVPSFVVGRASMFTEGIVASLATSKYRIVQRAESAAQLDLSDVDSDDDVLCLIVQEGFFNRSKVADDLALLRTARPSARLVTVRNEKLATIEDLLSSDANGFVQGSFGPKDFIGILDLLFATPCKLYIVPPEVAAPAPVPGGKKSDVDALDSRRSPQNFNVNLLPSLSLLSKREREILDGLGRGQANKMMARQLDISESTVKAHVRSLLHKLKAENRTQAAMRLFEQDDFWFKADPHGHQQP